MKSPMLLLWRYLADDLASMCQTSTTADVEYVRSRVELEGLSFLTISLPSFARDFEQSLARGSVESGSFLGFKRARHSRGLPLFLRGFLTQVFDPSSGVLRDSPSIDAIFAVRQLTLMYGKMLIPCSDARVRAAVDGYVTCEQELESWSDDNALTELRRVGTILFGSIFERINQSVHEGDLNPRHGPGATADKLRGNAKFDQRQWTTRLESCFPFGEYAIPSWRSYYLLDDVEFLEPGAERPVKVITVPKTLKTPRIIAVEPTCMQYAQQALSNEIVRLIERELGGLIGFTDQVPNQHLARLGSLDGSLATLDLSEASDRVSNQHVIAMIDPIRFPFLAEAVQAVRSTKADVPGHGIIPLAKYASMGSALTFPLEAMIFLCMVYLGFEERHGRHLSRREFFDIASGSVRIYGDDIIVPVDVSQSVVRTLDRYGHRVNSHKSFWNGLFRESCGREYYAGVDVSIVRVRREFPEQRTDVQELLSLVSLRNQLYNAGCWTTVAWLDERIVKLMRHFPIVDPTSAIIGRHSVLPYSEEQWSVAHQSPVVRGWVQRSVAPASAVSGEGALLKWFLKPGDLPFADKNHLERQGRPEVVGIKLRWAQPF